MYLILFTRVMSFVVLGQQIGSGEVLLRALESSSHAHDQDRIKQAVAEFEQSGQNLSVAQTARLRSIVKDDEFPLSNRMLALETAVREGGTAQRSELIALVRGFLAVIPAHEDLPASSSPRKNKPGENTAYRGFGGAEDEKAAARERRSEEDRKNRIALVRSFVAFAATALTEQADDNGELLNLYKDAVIALGGRIDLEAIRLAAVAITNSKAPKSLRQDAALDVMTARDPRYCFAFTPLIDQTLARRLREISVTFDAGGAPATRRLGCLDLLAEVGDVETAILYKRWCRGRGSEDRMIDSAGGFTWKISVQNDTELLLHYLASERRDEWDNDHSRNWALRKAIELGVPRHQIRDALLQFGDHVSDDWRFVGTLRIMKEVAMEAGILMAGDLPDIGPPGKTFLESLKLTTEDRERWERQHDVARDE